MMHTIKFQSTALRGLRLLALLSAALLGLFVLASCQAGDEHTVTTATTGYPSTSQTSSQTSETSTSQQGTASIARASSLQVKYTADDLDASWDSGTATTIQLTGTTAERPAGSAGQIASFSIDGGKITILAAGTYLISGTLTNGQIIVDTPDPDLVRLVLYNADIACADSSPINVRQSAKTIIILADQTTNDLSDGDIYVYDDAAAKEPNATVFSKSDLTITGSGSLIVTARFNNGITSKDKLRITGGSITVTAAGDGLKGRDYIAVRNCSLNITAGADGLKATNDEDTAKGFISIESGLLDIVAAADGIQAATSVLISGGDIRLATGGGSMNGPAHTGGGFGGQVTKAQIASAKGIKAAAHIWIDGGTLVIDSADDALNANNSLTIAGGSLTLASGDDGMHADAALTIEGGTLSITKSYEGIESEKLVISGGTIHVVASDDGVNGSGGNDGSSVNGRPGQNTFANAGNASLAISGGYLYVDAGGDGLDINGPVTMSAGTVLVNGPVENNNGALDYTGSFRVTGGLLVAVGSSGMAEMPDSSSTQYTVMVNFAQALAAGTLVRIETSSGDDLLTFMPTKTFQNVVLCSPDLTEGLSCIAYSGGHSAGSPTDGLYTGGDYTGGSSYTTFTISSILTTAGTQTGGMFPGGRPARR